MGPDLLSAFRWLNLEAEPVLRVEGLTVGVDGKCWPLEWGSFELPSEAIPSLVGPNGAGKSTWVAALGGGSSLAPRDGTVQILASGLAAGPALPLPCALRSR